MSFRPIRRLNLMCIDGYAHMQCLMYCVFQLLLEHRTSFQVFYRHISRMKLWVTIMMSYLHVSGHLLDAGKCLDHQWHRLTGGAHAQNLRQDGREQWRCVDAIRVCGWLYEGPVLVSDVDRGRRGVQPGMIVTWRSITDLVNCSP